MNLKTLFWDSKQSQIKKLLNYKFVDRIESYNFGIKFILIRLIQKIYELFFIQLFLEADLLKCLSLLTNF
jgi:hypothetical protein